MGKMDSRMDNVNKVILGDCVEGLKQLPDESISLVVTSPPYGETRTCYNSSVDYVALRNVLYPKMKDGGVIVWNETDQTVEGRKTLDSFKHLLMFCEEGYFNCFEHLIYAKNGRPGPWWNRRFRVDHEYLFIMVKGDKPKYFDKSHMDQKIKAYTSHGNTRQSNGMLSKSSGITKDTKSQGTVFFYNCSTAEGYQYRDDKLLHPATMPEKMPMDFIKTFTVKNDLVVDIFAGSGTVLRAAKRLNRQYLGFEIDENYVTLCNRLLKTIKPKLF